VETQCSSFFQKEKRTPKRPSAKHHLAITPWLRPLGSCVRPSPNLENSNDFLWTITKINNTIKISRKILNYLITKSYHKMQKNISKITNLRYIKGKQAGRTYHTQHKVHHTPLQATFRSLQTTT
jgi:hypothetical protein